MFPILPYWGTQRGVRRLVLGGARATTPSFRSFSSFPAFYPGFRSLEEGQGYTIGADHDGFSACFSGAIRLLPRCDQPSPAMLLCVREAVFRCAGYSTFNIRSNNSGAT
jgi:hypothetical protein